MKRSKIILCLIISILTISCKKSKIENLQTEIENEIKSGLNDPSSYEFNYFYIDSVAYMVKKQSIAENLKKIEKLKKQANTKSSEEEIKSLKFQNQLSNLMNKYKYTGSFEFRGNNKFGAKILADYKFEADSTFTLMYLMDNTGDTIYKDAGIIIAETDKLLKETEELDK